MPKVWLITGSASGLGRDIAEAVLASGDRLVATARKPQQLADLVARYGDKVRAVALDVTDAMAAKSAVQVAIVAFGRLDVVVNNAGFAHIGPFEELEAEDFRAQIETNLFGVVNVTRAALAPMRQQKSGHIVRLAAYGAPPPHLLLGSDAVHFAGEGDAAREASGKLWRAVSVATDFAATGPIPAFPPESASVQR